MEYLRETFDISQRLIYHARSNALILEDQFEEKLEFFCRDGKVQEHPPMPPASSVAADIFHRCPKYCKSLRESEKE